MNLKNKEKYIFNKSNFCGKSFVYDNIILGEVKDIKLKLFYSSPPRNQEPRWVVLIFIGQTRPLHFDYQKFRKIINEKRLKFLNEF